MHLFRNFYFVLLTLGSSMTNGQLNADLNYGRKYFTENRVIGEPIIQCNPDNIVFTARTEQIFQGRIFVRGMSLSHDPRCVRNYAPADSVTSQSILVQLVIPIGNCQMQKKPMLEPRGIEQAITVIMSFHPIFVTHNDQAFIIQCLFSGDATSNVITQNLSIGQLPGTQITVNNPTTPKCVYSIRGTAINGPETQFVNIGQQIFHVWTCQTDGTVGILIRNCQVMDSTRNRKIEIINKFGCPTEDGIIGNLNYRPALNEAFVSFAAFKFSDDVNVHFRCEIAFCRKINAHNGCQGVSPPTCHQAGLQSKLKQSERTTQEAGFGNQFLSHHIPRFSPRGGTRNSTSHRQSMRSINNADKQLLEFFGERLKKNNVEDSTQFENMVVDIVPSHDLIVMDPTDIRNPNSVAEINGIQGSFSGKDIRAIKFCVDHWSSLLSAVGILSGLLIVSTTVALCFCCLYRRHKRFFERTILQHQKMSYAEAYPISRNR